MLSSLTGQRLGVLTVLGLSECKGGRSFWSVRCDCGNEFVMAGKTLRNRAHNECVCWARPKTFKTSQPRAMSDEESALRCAYRELKHSAKIRGYECTLTLDEFKSVVTSDCAICGAKPHREVRARTSTGGSILLNGVDRVDNSIGYLPDNVQACCWACNRMRGTLSIKEFMNHILKISDFQGDYYNGFYR